MHMYKYFVLAILTSVLLLLAKLALHGFAADDYGDRVCIYKHQDFHASYSRLKPYPEPIDDGVCVYERPDFEGRFQCWVSGTEISDLGFGNWRDKISSVRILGYGRIVGYEDKDFRGERVFIDRDAANLTSIPMPESGNGLTK